MVFLKENVNDSSNHPVTLHNGGKHPRCFFQVFYSSPGWVTAVVMNPGWFAKVKNLPHMCAHGGGGFAAFHELIIRGGVEFEGIKHSTALRMALQLLCCDESLLHFSLPHCAGFPKVAAGFLFVGLLFFYVWLACAREGNADVRVAPQVCVVPKKWRVNVRLLFEEVHPPPPRGLWQAGG